MTGMSATSNRKNALKDSLIGVSLPLQSHHTTADRVITSTMLIMPGNRYGNNPHLRPSSSG